MVDPCSAATQFSDSVGPEGGGGTDMTMVDGARLFIGGEFRTAEKTELVVEAATEAPLGDGASAAPSRWLKIGAAQLGLEPPL